MPGAWKPCLRARAPQGSAIEGDSDAVFLERLPLTVGGRTLRAIRLDQMGKSQGNYDDDGGATVVTFESEIHQVAWLAEGIGQVKQEWRSTTTSSRVTNDDNTHVTLTQAAVKSMVMEITGESGPLR